MTLAPYPCSGVKVDGFCPQTPSYSARECTSGGAWWGSCVTGKPWPEGWGNADNWPTAARVAGFRVDTTPEIDSIMCVPPRTNGSGNQGHIAFVVGPVVGGKVQVIEMNFLIEHGWDTRNASVANCEFIHLASKPTPAPPPAPHPTPEDDMPKLGQFIAKTTTGVLAYFISDGMHFRHVLNPTDEAGVSATGPWFNGDGQPLRLWNPIPVADITAFGTPANKETADLLGLTFP
jgi:surface antigen